MVGAVVMVVTGIVSVTTATQVVAAKWDVYLFFGGMLTVTALAEQAGIFTALALWAARRSRGSKLLLLLNTCGLGVLISTFLTNDATALILSPVVYSIVRMLDLDPMPYLFACTFIADTASLTLPVSNPINILIGEHFGLTLNGFARYLWLPSAVAIIVNVVIFLIIFRRRLLGSFDTTLLHARTPEHPTLFRYTMVLLSLLAVAFVVASAVGAPVGIVAVAGAVILVGGALILRGTDLQKLIRETSWGIFPFITGLFIVVAGVEQVGLLHPVQTLLHAGHGNAMIAALVSVGVSAAGTNMINNVPMALLLISAIGSMQGPAGRALVYGALLGCDLGPNLTTTGSLSTMLWLLLLRRRGLEVSSLQYLRLGVLVTPGMLLATALILGAIV